MGLGAMKSAPSDIITPAELAEWIQVDGGNSPTAAINWGTQNLTNVGYLHAGATPTTHGLGAAGDIQASGFLEVDGIFYADGVAQFGSTANFADTMTIADGVVFTHGSNTNQRTRWRADLTFDQYVLGLGADHGRQLVIGESLYVASDYDHATPTNPTLFIHSAKDPGTLNTEWLGAWHNQTDGVISTGKGLLRLIPVAGSITQIGDAGATSHTLNTNDDLFVSGRLEVDGAAFFDSSPTIAVDGGVFFTSVAGAATGAIFFSTSLDQAFVGVNAAVGNHFILGSRGFAALNYGHVDQTNPTLYVHSETSPASETDEWWGVTHDVTDALYSRGSGVHKFDAVIRGATSLWVREFHISATALGNIGTAASVTVPSANTLGGWELDNVAKDLFWVVDIHSDWDAVSDMSVTVTWQLAVDNSGGAGGDTVDLALAVRYMGDGDVAVKSQSLEEAVVIGAAAQWTQFTTTFTIDWDAASNIVEIADHMSFVLNLETDTSEIDDIIVNHVDVLYDTAHPQIEK